MHHLTMNIQYWVDHHMALAWKLVFLVLFLEVALVVIVHIRTVKNRKYLCGDLASGIKSAWKDLPITCDQKKGHEGAHRSLGHYIKW